MGQVRLDVIGHTPNLANLGSQRSRARDDLFGDGPMLGPSGNRRIKGSIFESKGGQLRGVGRPVRRRWGGFHCGDDGGRLERVWETLGPASRRSKRCLKVFRAVCKRNPTLVSLKRVRWEISR